MNLKARTLLTLGLLVLAGLVLPRAGGCCGCGSGPMTWSSFPPAARSWRSTGDPDVFGSDERLIVAFAARTAGHRSSFSQDLRFFPASSAAATTSAARPRPPLPRPLRGAVAGEPYLLHLPDASGSRGLAPRCHRQARRRDRGAPPSSRRRRSRLRGAGIEERGREAFAKLERRRPGEYRVRLIGRQVVLNGLGQALFEDLSACSPGACLVFVLFWISSAPRSWRGSRCCSPALRALHPRDPRDSRPPALADHGDDPRAPDRARHRRRHPPLQRVPAAAPGAAGGAGLRPRPAGRSQGLLPLYRHRPHHRRSASPRSCPPTCRRCGCSACWRASASASPGCSRDPGAGPARPGADPKRPPAGPWTALPPAARLALRRRAGGALPAPLPGISRLRIDDGWTRNFRPDHPIVQDVRWFEKESVGVYQFDLMLTRKDGRAWTEPGAPRDPWQPLQTDRTRRRG